MAVEGCRCLRSARTGCRRAPRRPAVFVTLTTVILPIVVWPAETVPSGRDRERVEIGARAGCAAAARGGRRIWFTTSPLRVGGEVADARQRDAAVGAAHLEEARAVDGEGQRIAGLLERALGVVAAGVDGPPRLRRPACPAPSCRADRGSRSAPACSRWCSGSPGRWRACPSASAGPAFRWRPSRVRSAFWCLPEGISGLGVASVLLPSASAVQSSRCNPRYVVRPCYRRPRAVLEGLRPPTGRWRFRWSWRRGRARCRSTGSRAGRSRRSGTTRSCSTIASAGCTPEPSREPCWTVVPAGRTPGVPVKSVSPCLVAPVSDITASVPTVRLPTLTVPRCVDGDLGSGRLPGRR